MGDFKKAIPIIFRSRRDRSCHIVFLAIYRLERHNQYNRNTFLYQNCQINRFQGSNKRKLKPLLSNTPILARFQPFFPNLTKKRNLGRFLVKIWTFKGHLSNFEVILVKKTGFILHQQLKLKNVFSAFSLAFQFFKVSIAKNREKQPSQSQNILPRKNTIRLSSCTNSPKQHETKITNS